MAKHRIRHGVINAVGGISDRDCYNASVPMRIKDIFSRYKHRCHIKSLDWNGIKKESDNEDLFDEALIPPCKVFTLVVEIVLPVKADYQEVFYEDDMLEVVAKVCLEKK